MDKWPPLKIASKGNILNLRVRVCFLSVRRHLPAAVTQREKTLSKAEWGLETDSPVMFPDVGVSKTLKSSLPYVKVALFRDRLDG